MARLVSARLTIAALKLAFRYDTTSERRNDLTSAAN